MSKNSTSTIFNNLMDQLCVYALSETQPDALSVTRMKKLAKKITTTNLTLGASAYGIIAATEGNLEESEKQHAIAIKLSRKPHYVSYLATSKRILGYHAESYRLMQSIMKIMPDPIGLINSEIVLAFNTGHHQAVKIYYDELVRIKANIPTEILVRIYFNSLILKSNIDLNVFPLIASLLNEIQKNHHIKDPSVSVELIGDHLFYWVVIITDENTLNLMNEQLAKDLALLTPFNLHNFTIGFRTEVIT